MMDHFFTFSICLKTEWIDNVHVWKSKLPCYPLAQSYEKIDVPVLCKL